MMLINILKAASVAVSLVLLLVGRVVLILVISLLILMVSIFHAKE
jgi:hypothetical protein